MKFDLSIIKRRYRWNWLTRMLYLEITDKFDDTCGKRTRQNCWKLECRLLSYKRVDNAPKGIPNETSWFAKIVMSMYSTTVPDEARESWRQAGYMPANPCIDWETYIRLLNTGLWIVSKSSIYLFVNAKDHKILLQNASRDAATGCVVNCAVKRYSYWKR